MIIITYRGCTSVAVQCTRASKRMLNSLPFILCIFDVIIVALISIKIRGASSSGRRIMTRTSRATHVRRWYVSSLMSCRSGMSCRRGWRQAPKQLLKLRLELGGERGLKPIYLVGLLSKSCLDVLSLSDEKLVEVGMQLFGRHLVGVKRIRRAWCSCHG